jgi:NAD(P)-dependent dehydrogenase (short-subunit alcohol dehydrogenase family)
MLWLKHLVKLLKRSDKCVITALSARVGSIEDNGLGGWYSYRSSKSALNMMMKSLAIELKRQSPQSTVLLFHPGTTNTPLSKPFQKNVPAGKLFTPEFVAECLYNQIAESNSNDLINYRDWQGQSIQW